ncbi:class III extradiol ring-cleavage dioxygenase family protein [Jatrophihabitans fulvus]
MITAVAFVPQAPALVPTVGRGLDIELGPARASCRAAVQAVCAGAHHVVVVGGAAQPSDPSTVHTRFSRGGLDGFEPGGAGGAAGYEVQLGGVSCGGGVPLTPALTVGAHLLHNLAGIRLPALAVSVGDDWPGGVPVDDVLMSEREVALLVVGDGSARRTEKAPGYLDERAGAHDRDVAAALASGRAFALAGLDADEGARQLAAGVPAWRATADLLTRAGLTDGWQADVTYDDAPFGVGYFVATWLRA